MAFSSFRILLVILALGTLHGGTHAQSGYALTTLQPMVANKPIWTSNRMAIDPQNRVIGTASSVFTFDIVPPFYFYAGGIVRWPASTAASVAPTRLLNKFSVMSHASTDGSKVIYDMNKVLDTNTGKLLTYGLAGTTPESAITSSVVYVHGVNNQGWVTGDYPTQMVGGTATAVRAAVWRPGQRGETLPSQGTASGHAINSQGLVVGAAGSAAAQWRNGTLTLLPEQASSTARAEAVNSAGQVLVRHVPQAPTEPVNYTLDFNGSSQPVMANDPAWVAWPSALNASGTVVGRVLDPRTLGTQTHTLDISPFRTAFPAGRAFIWQNGVMSDLTELVASKGVKLPAGALLEDALAINDQGSIVATLRSASGVTTLVRLTAKP